MIKSVSILGSTGSIGRQTAAVCRHLGLPVVALAAHGNIDLLEQQAREFRPKYAAVFDEDAAAELARRLSDTDIRVGAGMAGLMEAAALPEAECVVTAVSGAVGLRPTLAAIDAKKRVALANKETLVCAGEIVMARAAERGAEIVPVDSEHCAIFQCLEERRSQLRKILLTGSGGPFRGWTREQTESVTPEQAVCHPNWQMGAKISVDSATMMNKGLEFIEAMRLFAVTPEEIEVVIHPESVVHSMVELTDGAVIAQLGAPDMEVPIQYALTYPERRPSLGARLDFAALSALHFEAPDLEKMPCLRLAMDCARRGGTSSAILSAANEVAVSLFLGHRLGFNSIYDCVDAALQSIKIVSSPTLEEILEADGAARRFVRERFS
jgi:1-deoxy-D-xylulose-5-phosphate reductoisomerase